MILKFTLREMSFVILSHDSMLKVQAIAAQESLLVDDLMCITRPNPYSNASVNGCCLPLSNKISVAS